MAAKKLTVNVVVDGVPYGPDYPDNTPSADVLDRVAANAALFERDEEAAEAQHPEPVAPKAAGSRTKT